MFDAYAREKAFDYKHGVSHNVIEDKVSGIVEVRFFHARFDDRAESRRRIFDPLLVCATIKCYRMNV